ncbi:MAG TPA: response regulator [Candidatus Latescibacteria bacterium]|nr:response regulator [Candidatus Handelsmanbacteria bacterium]HIL08334.1 response regulator [Candidatus Latescibacterota bacterium]
MSETNQSARTLIVDDTLPNIQALGTVLHEKGYRLNVAQNGETGPGHRA